MKHGIIDYEVIGEGCPVLIIHGWGICRITMKAAFEPAFAKLEGYKRYYIDLPGMGNSVCGNVKNADDILALLYDFAVNVIREKFIIAGQSFGSFLARAFVNRHQDMVLKMILLCPCVIPGVKKGRVEPVTIIEKDENLLATLTEDEYKNFTMMNVLLTKDVWTRYKEFIFPALKKADWDFLNHTLKGELSFNPDKYDSPCKIPCLIIAGKEDSVVGYKDQFDLMKVYVNSTYCAVENAGHNLQIEKPELFENLLISWLN
ncbi:MAG: alpha/beta hydrolase [Treponema sp.]|nr:alpha/beta hydrolase [Treponema sp.]